VLPPSNSGIGPANVRSPPHPASFALKLGHKDRRLATEQRRELGVPIRSQNMASAEMTEALNRGWKNATADHPVQLERCASRSKLIPAHSRGARPRSAAGWRSKTRVKAVALGPSGGVSAHALLRSARRWHSRTYHRQAQRASGQRGSSGRSLLPKRRR